MIPEQFKYSKTHEWFSVDSKHITVGLTRYIVDELNKLLFLDLPKVGDEILPGICFGEIESISTLLDITSPLSGEIVAVNEHLYENLDTLSTDPYKDGWLIKFRTNDLHLLEKLLSAREYNDYIGRLQLTDPQRQRKRRSKILKNRRRK